MQVICTDGTVFSCESFEVTQYGVTVYGQERDDDRDRYEGDPEQFGYVPHDRLWYILPDGVASAVAGPPAPQGPPRPEPQGAGPRQEGGDARRPPRRRPSVERR